VLDVDPALERKQAEQLHGVRDRRDGNKVERELSQLNVEAAHTDRNLMPSLIECARAHVSEGEIIVTLQEVFGSFKDIPVCSEIPARRRAPTLEP
jgi:methylmalonyl-CoA mutase N-terminal domain/subunit